MRQCFVFALALTVLMVSTGALAQAGDAPVYRCGSSYSNKPCPGAASVDAADSRSAVQQREAHQASQREAALARQMKADRLADERRAAGAANVGPTVAKPTTPAASKTHKPKRAGHAAAQKASSAPH
jgi:hypothetical protein